ncbi:MAG: hypothetical protein H6760_05190 [Candidatus Nomurabacteria bacterium]|nr:MAG: hypothetical protein H6760_05190 [Candidatus Nomurabacteria bacterium]
MDRPEYTFQNGDAVFRFTGHLGRGGEHNGGCHCGQGMSDQAHYVLATQIDPAGSASDRNNWQVVAEFCDPWRDCMAAERGSRGDRTSAEQWEKPERIQEALEQLQS